MSGGNSARRTHCKILSNEHQYIRYKYNPMCKNTTRLASRNRITSSVAQVKDFNSAVVGPKLFQQRQSHGMEFLNGFYCNNLRESAMEIAIYNHLHNRVYNIHQYKYKHIECMISMQIACVTYNLYLLLYSYTIFNTCLVISLHWR